MTPGMLTALFLGLLLGLRHALDADHVVVSFVTKAMMYVTKVRRVPEKVT